MPHRRRVQKGSFGGHFDELIAQFAAGEMPSLSEGSSAGPPAKREGRVDVHALLFERAWRIEDDR